MTVPSTVIEPQTSFGIDDSGVSGKTGHGEREPARKQQTGAVHNEQTPPKPKSERFGLILRFIRSIFGKTSPTDGHLEIPKSLPPGQVAASNEAVNAALRRILARQMQDKKFTDTVAAPRAEPSQGISGGTGTKAVLRITLIGGEMYHVLARDLARAETGQSLWVSLCDTAGNHIPRHGSNSPPSLLLSTVRSGRIDAMSDLLLPVVSVDDSAAQRLYPTMDDPNQKPTEQGQKL